MTLDAYITIRRLHELAFGVHVAAWFDEAVEIWRQAYGQEGDPPVLLLNDGGARPEGGKVDGFSRSRRLPARSRKQINQAFAILHFPTP